MNNTTFLVKTVDIAGILKYGQGHWKCYEQVKINQHYHHAKLKRPPLNISLRQKANIKVFVKLGNTPIISLEYVQKWKIVVYLLSTWLTYQSYKVST